MDQEETSLMLQAGAEAFGDGAHPTTTLLLEGLDGVAPSLLPHRILDFGCGSGILGLRALQLWPDSRLVAVDCDRSAVEATLANAKANALGERLQARHATTPADKAIAEVGPYDLILMNILAEPILGLLHGIESVLAHDGVLMLSGLMVWQETPIREGAEGLGLELAYRLQSGDWVAHVWQKPGL